MLRSFTGALDLRLEVVTQQFQGVYQPAWEQLQQKNSSVEEFPTAIMLFYNQSEVNLQKKTP